MPADNGSGCHLDERFLPSSPALSQYDPEQLVGRSEAPARALGVKSEQLLTQGKIFEDDILAGPECTNKPSRGSAGAIRSCSESYRNVVNRARCQVIDIAGVRCFDERQGTVKKSMAAIASR